MKEVEKIVGSVVVVLRNINTNEITVFETHNIITSAGDKHYAQKFCGEIPSVDFSGIRLGSDDTAPTKADIDVTTYLENTSHALASGYPKTNDDDSHNTGTGENVVTWKYSYEASESIASSINEGAIVDNIVTPTSALCHFIFSSSFNKTINEELMIFVNHTIDGV